MLSLRLGTLVFVVEVALASLRRHSASRLLYLFLCECGAVWEMSSVCNMVKGSTPSI